MDEAELNEASYGEQLMARERQLAEVFKEYDFLEPYYHMVTFLHERDMPLTPLVVPEQLIEDISIQFQILFQTIPLVGPVPRYLQTPHMQEYHYAIWPYPYNIPGLTPQSLPDPKVKLIKTIDGRYIYRYYMEVMPGGKHLYCILMQPGMLSWQEYLRMCDYTPAGLVNSFNYY